MPIAESPVIGSGSDAIFELNADGGGGFEEASLFNTDQGDAYDDVLEIEFDGTETATLLNDFGTDVVTVNGNRYTYPLQMLNGLVVLSEAWVLADSPKGRVLQTLTNPTGADITGTVRIRNNLGSDSNTTALMTASGDQTIDLDGSDWYTITDDDAGIPGQGDPVVTLVLYGENAPVTADGVTPSDTFNSIDYIFSNVTIPAGESISFLLFTQVHSDPADAMSVVGDFGSLSAGDPLLAGLTEEQLGRVVNFNFDGCPCDIDGVDGVDVADLLTFLSAWFVEDPAAEFDGMASVTIGDLLAYLTCWFSASNGDDCP